MNPDIEIPRGDDETINFAPRVTDLSTNTTTNLDISGYTVLFIAKKSWDDPDSEAVIPLKTYNVSATPQAGTGTISSSGTTVTGSGTAFSTQLSVGDRIVSGSQTRTITAIASNTSLTTDTAFSPTLSGASFTFIDAVYSQNIVLSSSETDIPMNDYVYGVRLLSPTNEKTTFIGKLTIIKQPFD